MGLADVSPRLKAAPDAAVECGDLAHRVASSSTFEKSPRLRAFLIHVCHCALDNKPEAATEQQIGIRVYERPSGYNPNEDNIVRSQARLLRLKLEHYFANEGKDEPIIITIPKGRYLPVFEPRPEESVVPPTRSVPEERRSRHLLHLLIGVAVLFGLAILCLGYLLLKSRTVSPRTSAAPNGATVRPEPNEAGAPSRSKSVALVPIDGEVRVTAGYSGPPYVDVWGHRWEADRYYQGGVARPGPQHFFPPVPDPGLFKNIREANSGDDLVPRQFRYDIPVRAGVYELRLFFADPLRRPDIDQKEDAQNSRHFRINLNGRALLMDFDPISDAGPAAVDVRVFRDVRPAADGKLHLEFVSGWGSPAFLSALELTPGTPGKLKPIRFSVRRSDYSDYVDAGGTHWNGDNYFIEGRTHVYQNPQLDPKIPALYATERLGNFSYAIPVAPGSYTVRLHFLESFFSPLIPAAHCQGEGCRVFDVTCNGVMLLQNFDIFQAARGAFRPIIREFHGLHPNGQGKLLLSFLPQVNYAEVRAVEVIDEAK